MNTDDSELKQRGDRLLDLCLLKTREGKLTWETTAESNEAITVFGGRYILRLSTVHPPMLRLELAGSGARVGSVVATISNNEAFLRELAELAFGPVGEAGYVVFIHDAAEAMERL